MNKNIKRIIALTIVLGSLSFSDAFMTRANASSDIYLRSISVMDGDSITLSKSKKTYSTDVTNSMDIAYIRVGVNDEDDIVEIDDADTIEKKGSKKYYAEVPLQKGKNEIEIVVKSDDGDEERTYKLKVDRGGKQSDDEESVFLDDIELDEGEIDFSKKDTEYNLDLDEDIKEIRITAKPEDDDDKVYIEGTRVDEEDKYRKYVKLYDGDNQILINIEDEDDDENQKTYTLNIYKGEDAKYSRKVDSSKFDNSQDSVYLDDILINDGDLEITPYFNKKITKYTANVAEDVESVIVKGATDEDVNIVRINGVKADSRNRKRIYLEKGKNVVEIKVNTDFDKDDDDYKQRIYTLTIYRGEHSEETNDEKSAISDNVEKKKEENNIKNAKVNQWVNVGGKWRFNDVTGSPIKSTWYTDIKSGQVYYLDQNGDMLTGWLLNGFDWYYLNIYGSRTTGWNLIGTKWYYMNYEGKMMTGWQYINGDWYYLYSDGSMAQNTVIGNYKLSIDGKWIK